MTKDQTSGVLERLAYAMIMAVLAKLVAKGYLTDDMATYAATGIIAAAGSAWAWWINRPKALVQSAAALPGTIVVTQPALAQATPQVNIVSNADAKVVSQ